MIIRTSRGYINTEHITHAEIGTGEYRNEPNRTYLLVYVPGNYMKLWDKEAEELIKYLDFLATPLWALNKKETE